MSASERADITGVWDGLFSYPRGLQPVSFLAVLLDTGTSVTGTIHEQPRDGPSAGLVLNAAIDGARSGSSISFIKTYDVIQGGRPRRPVSYDGVVNADATEIEGRWAIPGNWSGKFLMVRSGSALAATELRHEETVPAR